MSVLVLMSMGIGATLALCVLAGATRRARACGDLDASAALTFGIAALINLPTAVAVISGGYQRRPDEFRELVAVLPGWYAGATRLALAAAAGLAALLLLRRLAAGRAPVHVPGLILVCLWMVTQLASALHGGGLPSLHALALLPCLAATVLLPRGRGACIGAAIFGVALAIVGGFLAAIHPDRAFVMPCEGACSGLGFRGVFPNDSLMGVTLAASVPFVYVGFRGRARFWLTLYLVGMALATGSRTASLAVLLALVVLLVVRPRLQATSVAPGRNAAAAIFLAAAAVASAYVPHHDWSPEFLTGRPHLWDVASSYVSQSPVVGYGPERWEALAKASEIPMATQRSAHNLWLDVLFAAGAVGAGLLAAFTIAAVRTAGPAWPALALIFGTLFMLGATEGIWSTGRLDFLSFTLVAAALTGRPERAPPRASPPQRRTARADPSAREPRTQRAAVSLP